MEYDHSKNIDIDTTLQLCSHLCVHVVYVFGSVQFYRRCRLVYLSRSQDTEEFLCQRIPVVTLLEPHPPPSQQSSPATQLYWDVIDIEHCEIDYNIV